MLYYNCSKGNERVRGKRPVRRKTQGGIKEPRAFPTEKKVSRGASGDANRNRKAVKNSTISSATKKFFKEILKNPLTTNAECAIMITESERDKSLH